MRAFYFINDKGVRFDFNYSTRVLFVDPKGLGFEKSVEYLKFGEVFKKNIQRLETSQITATLIFLSGYEGYASFIKFIQNSLSFDFYYVSNDTKFINCEIESLDKTEIQEGVLKCNITIKKLSYWFKKTLKDFSFQTDNEGKIYSYRYPYKYANSYKGSISLINGGYSKAPLKFIMKGAVNNPEITIKKNGVKVSKLRIFYESKDAEIVVDAFPTNQHITIKDKDKVFNGYDYQDFECENFLFLEQGKYELEYNPNVTGDINCSVVMIEGYLGN